MRCCSLNQEGGTALLIVLGIIMVVSGLSVSFIAFMNRAQTYAGARYRATAAMAVAEAGVHRALQIFESVAPDGSDGRAWRPSEYSENLQVGSLEGRFNLSALEEPDGAIIVTSAGEVGGVVRRLRARIYLASPALLAAVYTPGFMHLEKPPAAVLVLSDGMTDRKWGHIAAGKGVWFEGPGVSVKGGRVRRDLSPGPSDSAPSMGKQNTATGSQALQLILAGDAELLIGQDQRRVEVHELRAMGVDVEDLVVRKEVLPRLPDVDEAFYHSLANANTDNASLNEAAGRHHGDSKLAAKVNSLYSKAEFEQLQVYLAFGTKEATLRGVVYVTGDIDLLPGERLRVTDGGLVCQGTVLIAENASLEITHSPLTRTLPGLVTLRKGSLVIEAKGNLRVHGLVYSSSEFDVDEEARVEIVGAIVSGDHEVGLRNFAATVTVRYDPAVLGTPGLRVPNDSPVIAWVAAWEELEGLAPTIPPVPLVAQPDTAPGSEPAAPALPPASPVWPSPTAPSAPSPVAPSPQAPGMTAPSLRTPAVVAPQRDQKPVDMTVTQAVRPSASASPAAAMSSRRTRIAEAPGGQGQFTVQIGAFSIRGNAEELIAALRRDGFPPRTVVDRGLYKVRIGAFHNRAQAQELADQLRARGYAVIIVQ